MWHTCCLCCSIIMTKEIGAYIATVDNEFHKFAQYIDNNIDIITINHDDINTSICISALIEDTAIGNDINNKVKS